MSENYNSVKFAGLTIVVILFLSFLYILSNTSFQHAKFISYELMPIEPADDLGRAMGAFLWDYRGLDLIMQTLILLSTAISCIALLREEK